jgi:GTPase SAR1 family protein
MNRREPEFVRLTYWLTSLTAALAVLTVVLFGSSEMPWIEKLPHAMSSVLGVIIGVLVAAMSVLFLTFWMRTLNRNPFPLKVALLGQPNAGKSVYLTMLFRELPFSSSDTVSFQPYGLETIETVSKNIKSLTGGFWLAPTTKDSVFFFRANATLGKSVFRRRYTVEIGDFAGERIVELGSSGDYWLHRSEYFKYAIGCDVLMLAVDGAILATGKSSEIEEMQLRLIAALQILIDEKGVSPEHRLSTPVAVLVLKSDLLAANKVDPDQALDKIQRLIALGERRCRDFRWFFVSAIGTVAVLKDNAPPSELNPIYVVEPMMWALQHFRRGA